MVKIILAFTKKKKKETSEQITTFQEKKTTNPKLLTINLLGPKFHLIFSFSSVKNTCA